VGSFSNKDTISSRELTHKEQIKVIKRIAFGYKSFELFRGRILYIFMVK